MTWSRALERSLCYAYGCWEVLEQQRPRPIDLIVGRSIGPGLEPVRTGVLAGGARGQLPGLLLSRPPPRPGRRGRARDPAGLLSLAAVDGRDRSPGPGAGRPGLDAHGMAARACSRPSTATNSWSCTTASTPAGSRAPPGTPRRAGPRSIAGRVDPRRDAGRQLRRPVARPPPRASTDSWRSPTPCFGPRRRAVRRRGRPDRPPRAGRRVP